jgi:outer membrane murein-binding lipoprotein Lpp
LELFRLLDALLMPENPFEDGMMKAYHLTIAAAAAGLLLAAGSASATPLAPKSAAAMGVDPLNAAVEPVHYRRHRGARHHYYYPRYRAPAVTFGFAPVVTPYYAYPYGYSYRPYYPRYPHPYTYGYAPTFSFGFHLR